MPVNLNCRIPSNANQITAQSGKHGRTFTTIADAQDFAERTLGVRLTANAISPDTHVMRDWLMAFAFALARLDANTRGKTLTLQIANNGSFSLTVA